MKTEERLIKYTVIYAVTIIILAIFTALVVIHHYTSQDESPPIVDQPIVIEVEDSVPVEISEDFENEKIEEALLARSHKIENCTITHYCTELRPHICGTGTGITASGRKVQPYISCAVDPNVIPFGSTIMVDYGDGELHYYVADDTGSAIDGNHIDLAVTTHEEALKLGIKTATVYWCEEGLR